MKYAMLIDAKGNMIGNAERSGQQWRGQVAGKPLEAWRGNLTTVARELCADVKRAVLLSEPIWAFGGVVIC